MNAAFPSFFFESLLPSDNQESPHECADSAGKAEGRGVSRTLPHFYPNATSLLRIPT